MLSRQRAVASPPTRTSSLPALRKRGHTSAHGRAPPCDAPGLTRCCRAACETPCDHLPGQLPSITLPPSGSGMPPVRSAHHSPRSTIFFQPLVLIRELAFVNQQSRGDPAFPHGILNLVERHHRVRTSGSYRRSVRNAVVNVPGTATVTPFSVTARSTAQRRWARSCRPCSSHAAAGGICRSDVRKR